MTRLLRLAQHICAGQFRITQLFMIGYQMLPKPGEKSAGHSKLIRNVLAGRIFPCGKATHENPLQLLGACLMWWLHHQKSTPGTRILPATPGSFCMNCLDPHRGAFASFPKKLTNARQLPSRENEHACKWLSHYSARQQVIPHFSSGIVERTKCERA